MGSQHGCNLNEPFRSRCAHERDEWPMDTAACSTGTVVRDCNGDASHNLMNRKFD